MNTALDHCFILHRRPYRESSLLLDVLSQQQGRVSVIAKGVRKKAASHYQPYQPLLMSWVGRSELQTVTAIETAAPSYRLTADAALCGLYINELLLKLLPLHEAEPAIFDVYQATLKALNESDSHEIALRLFEKKLLEHLGYGLELDKDAQTGRVIDQNGLYDYQAQAGLVRCDDKQTNGLISGRSLLHLMAETGFDQQSLSEIKRLMRMVVDIHLDGRPLQSRQLFAQLKRLK